MPEHLKFSGAAIVSWSAGGGNSETGRSDGVAIAEGEAKHRLAVGPKNAFPRCMQALTKRTMVMRKAILAAAIGTALVSPAFAADLAVTPYGPGPGYERDVYAYPYRAPPVVVEEPAPVVTERVIVPPPVIVQRRPVVVDEYPIYAPPVYAGPPVYAYAGPAWGYRHRLRDGW